MLYKFYRSNSILTQIALPLFGILLFFMGFWQQRPLLIEGHVSPFFDWINSFFGSYTWVKNCFSWLFILFNAWLLNRTLNEAGVYPKENYLSSFFYVLFAGCYFWWWDFNMSFMLDTCIIFTLRALFGIYRDNKVYSHVFNAGFWVGLSCVVNIKASILLVFVWTSILILRQFNWREMVIPVLGFSLPFLYVFAYAYLINTPEVLHAFFNFSAAAEHSESLPLYALDYVLVGMLSVCTLIALFKIQQLLPVSTNRERKLKSILLVYLIFFAVFNLWVAVPVKVGLSLIPLAVLLPFHFMQLKRFWLGQLIFYSLLALVLLRFYFHH